ncbi:MAG: transcriptional regulator [Anaerolineae bacterium]|nr:transcriptional regulator [Anaerolineae bacterium]
MLIPQVIRTKITPPTPSVRDLYRQRVALALGEAIHYRLTLLHASAGYGKSTALTSLAQGDRPIIWYQITEDDNDLFVFLLHLLHATQLALPHIDNLPIPLIEGWDNIQDPLPIVEIIHQYLNALSSSLTEPTILVLDDIHLVADVPEIAHALDRLIGLAPSDLRVLLSSRLPVQLPNLSRWQVRGDVLSIDHNILKFNRDEISVLFAQQYDYKLTESEVDSLTQLTEGWAIALQLAWQSLRSGAVASIDEVMNRGGKSLGSLFEVLTQEVMQRQPEDIQEFLRISASLRVMTPSACDALRDASDSEALLDYLRRHELFVVDLGEGGLRYHHIFHRYLRGQTDAKQRQAWHQRAALYYQKYADFDTAIYHLFLAEDENQAANLLNSFGARLLATGRLDTLAAHLDNLSPETLHQHPALLSYLGDLARLHSRFQEALGWYQQAETLCTERGLSDGLGRSLRGQARVYLDTVSPSRAEELLQQALRISDGTADRESQARLYQLLAENKLNAGKVEDAEKLHQQAEALVREGPADSQLRIRVLLRTGRLAEAKKQLEELAETEQHDPVHTPRAHRETQLLLSIIYAMQGDAKKAYQSALEGIQRGEEFNSPFVTAVGHMRLGHALMLLSETKEYAQSREQFEKAIEISRTLAIPRLRVEACWGLCRTYGSQENLTEARKAAHEGIELANLAGDEWNASLARLTMGANLILAELYEEAADWLGQAVRGFRECSDPFGANAARLWLCLGWYRQNDLERISQTLPDLLTTCRQHTYDYLFTRPTLLGLPDERLAVPLLILAREHGWEGTYPKKLLNALGLSEIKSHPGYQLKVHTLGAFQAWRGEQEIAHNGWRREKTRQLFQILLTYRQNPLNRDQLCEHLWPGMDPETSQRNFKVALNTLYNVLEPNREAGSESTYIVRVGTSYTLRPEADIWLDSAQFLQKIRQSENILPENPQQAMALMKTSLDIYRGEYLPNARYETWAAAEREQLSVLYLRTADQYCELSLKENNLEETIELCQQILSYDNCWERAYRYLMLAYDQLGDHGQVARTYQRCLETLNKELDVRPAPETEELYRRLTDNE